MTRAISVLFITLFASGNTLACLNGESMVLKNGTLLYEDWEGNVPYGHEFYIENDFRQELHELDSLYKATKDIDYLSDKGILLILLHQYNKAIRLYLDIEQIEPGRYSTAANIGTAYELAGQNENALKWIRKCVEIDSNSHKGSEWIHVKILEAKIKGEDYYTSSFLLGVDFGSGNAPTTTASYSTLRQLSDALYYQLNERISFVKPRDKIVAQLLFDLGNIAFLTGEYADAIDDYNSANEYGFGGPLIENRIILSKTKSEKPYYLLFTAFITIALGLALSVAAIRRKRKKSNQNTLD